MPLPSSSLLVSQALAPSHALFALVFLLTLRFLFQYLHSLFLGEFGLLTPSTRSPPLSSVCDPSKSLPFLSRLSSCNGPGPAVCLKVWVTLAHWRVIQNVSSSCSTGAPQPTFSPDLSRLFTRGPPLGPSPLNVWPPAPDCSPAVMNVTAVLLGQTSS